MRNGNFCISAIKHTILIRHKKKIAIPPAPLIITNIVNGTIVTAQQQKRSGRIERQNRQQILNLPMLGHRMPNANFPGRRQRHQLAANEKQILNANVQIENANVRFCAIVRYAPQPHLISIRNGNHFAERLFGGTGKIHLCIDGQPFDNRIDVRRCEHQLPTGRILQSIAGDKMWIGHRNPILMGFDNLHAQRIRPNDALWLGAAEQQTDIVSYQFVQVDRWVSGVAQIKRCRPWVARRGPTLFSDFVGYYWICFFGFLVFTWRFREDPEPPYDSRKSHDEFREWPVCRDVAAAVAAAGTLTPAVAFNSGTLTMEPGLALTPHAAAAAAADVEAAADWSAVVAAFVAVVLLPLAAAILCSWIGMPG